MIKAVTWGWNSRRGSYQTKEAKISLSLLLSKINLSHVILAFWSSPKNSIFYRNKL